MTKIIIFCFILLIAFFSGQVFTSLFFRRNIIREKQTLFHLSPEQFSAELSTGEYVLLDVRTADEYTAGHLKNAKQIDYYQTQQFSNYLDSLDKNRKYLVYCRTGIRSGKTLQIMQQKGFNDVSDMAGGYNAWTADNFPTEK